MPSINRSNSRAEQKSFLPVRILSAIASLCVAFQSLAGVTVWSWSPASTTFSDKMVGMVRAFPDSKPSEIAAQLNAKPAGQRVLCVLQFTERLGSHPLDACKSVDAAGKTVLTAFPGPWYDNGLVEVKAKMVKFFDALRTAGVKGIDALVVDNETTFWAGRYVTNDGSNTAAIEKDPRFPTVAKRLGFSKLKLLAWGGTEYLRWNEVIQPDFDVALNAAVTTPFQARWPKGVVCNYGSAPIARKYMTPDMSGLGLVYGGAGFGTHNSLSFYGNSLQWIRGRQFAGTTLNDSAFDMFRMNVHRIRAAKASSTRTMLPWIANYSLGCNNEASQPGSDLGGYASPLANNKYWDENVIQLVMHGCDTLMLFNPAAWRADQDPTVWNKFSDQQRLSNVIDEVNGQLGATPGVSRWFSLPGLQDRVMATGRRVAGGTLWRFSFAPGVASVTVAMKNGDVREIVPQAGEVGAWLFEADSNMFAVKADGTDIAFAEAPAGAAWPDLDDSGELDQGDISLLLLDMNQTGSEFDINGDNVITNADVTAFKSIQKNWFAQATQGRTTAAGSVLVTVAR